jgi:exopolysaccharide biosynthesis polyprenyl glycosylphosphotransferase
MADIQLDPISNLPLDPEAEPPVADSDARRDAPYRAWLQKAAGGDLVAAGIAAFVASLIRFGVGGGDRQVVAPSWLNLSYTQIGVLVTILWPLLLGVCGAYDLRTLLVGVEEGRRVLRSAIALVAALGFLVFAGDVSLARGYVAPLIGCVALFTGAWRYVLRRAVARKQGQGMGHHNVVAVGPADELLRLCQHLRATPDSPIDIVAIVADDLEPDTELPPPMDQITRLPDREAIRGLRDSGVPIDLLVRAGRPRPEEVWALARRAHDLGVAVAIAPHREDASAHIAVSYVPLGRTPLLVVETPTLHPTARITKAVFDRLLASVMVICLSPVLLAIALAILITDGRPILYKQERVGRAGKHFQCLKFRTMATDADQRLEELLHLNEADGPLFKLKDDPRVTKIGGFLRNHSLDELPQLFNVLAGSMSIVGPRPPLPREVATYNEREARRLLVKPGLTGLWQVEGRSDLPWDEGVYLDLLYVEHWSPILDLAIVARTARTVIRPTGAY